MFVKHTKRRHLILVSLPTLARVRHELLATTFVDRLCLCINLYIYGFVRNPIKIKPDVYFSSMLQSMIWEKSTFGNSEVDYNIHKSLLLDVK